MLHLESDGCEVLMGKDGCELKWFIEKMKECLDKPILWAGKRFPQEYKAK